MKVGDVYSLPSGKRELKYWDRGRPARLAASLITWVAELEQEGQLFRHQRDRVPFAGGTPAVPVYELPSAAYRAMNFGSRRFKSS